LTAAALGVHGVWAAGVGIVDAAGARATGALPGRLLRDFMPG